MIAEHTTAAYVEATEALERASVELRAAEATADELRAAETSASEAVVAAETAWTADESDERWTAVVGARTEREKIALRRGRAELEVIPARERFEAARIAAMTAEMAKLVEEHGPEVAQAIEAEIVERATRLEREAADLMRYAQQRAGEGFRAVERAHELAQQLRVPRPAYLPVYDARLWTTAARKAIWQRQMIEERLRSDGEAVAELLTPLSALDQRWSAEERDEAHRKIADAREEAS